MTRKPVDRTAELAKQRRSEMKEKELDQEVSEALVSDPNLRPLAPPQVEPGLRESIARTGAPGQVPRPLGSSGTPPQSGRVQRR